MTKATEQQIRAALTEPCPWCGVEPGRRCHNGNGHSTVHPPHRRRIDAAAERAAFQRQAERIVETFVSLSDAERAELIREATA